MLMNEIELPKTMAAVVCHAPEDYRLEEMPVPEVGAGEVLVRVESAGICASDLKCYLGAPLFWGDATPQGYCEPPITPGHEFVGKVVALGDGAAREVRPRDRRPRRLRADRAVLEVPLLQDAASTGCAQPHDIYGFRQRTPGAMAEYMSFPADALNHKVPASMPRRTTRRSSSRCPARSTRSSAATSSSRTPWSSPARAARPRHGRGGADEEAGAADRARPQRRPARAGEALRRRPRPQPDQGRRWSPRCAS